MTSEKETTRQCRLMAAEMDDYEDQIVMCVIFTLESESQGVTTISMKNLGIVKFSFDLLLYAKFINWHFM